jgi:hypothetical protein
MDWLLANPSTRYLVSKKPFHTWYLTMVQSRQGAEFASPIAPPRQFFSPHLAISNIRALPTLPTPISLRRVWMRVLIFCRTSL